MWQKAKTNGGQDLPGWNSDASRRSITLRATKTWSNFSLKKQSQTERLSAQSKYPPRGYDGRALTQAAIAEENVRHTQQDMLLCSNEFVTSRFQRSEVLFPASEYSNTHSNHSSTSASASAPTMMPTTNSAGGNTHLQEEDAQLQEAIRLSMLASAPAPAPAMIAGIGVGAQATRENDSTSSQPLSPQQLRAARLRALGVLGSTGVSSAPRRAHEHEHKQEQGRETSRKEEGQEQKRSASYAGRTEGGVHVSSGCAGSKRKHHEVVDLVGTDD
jgi:hypothetical protein